MDSTSDMKTMPAIQKPTEVEKINTDEIPLTKSELVLQKREKALDVELNGSARKTLYKGIREGLGAMRTGRVLDADGDLTTEEVPDYNVRHKYIETGLKIIGDLVEVKTEVNVDASQRTLQISVAEREELERLRSVIHEVSGKDGGTL